MDKDKSAVESFLSELDTKDDKQPFENNQEDPFNQEVLEEKGEEVMKEEKPLPFNKDPKVLKFIEKELDKRLKDRIQEVERPQETKVDDDYYVRLIGNDTPEKVAMIKEAIARDERMLQQAEERAFNRLSAVEQEEAKADQEAEEELDTAFENIEGTFDVDFSTTLGRKTRSEFVSFVEKIAPKDRNGDIVDFPDMLQAFETFSELKRSTATPSRAKELASRSMARSSEAPSTKDTKSLNFDNIIDHITSQ